MRVGWFAGVLVACVPSTSVGPDLIPLTPEPGTTAAPAEEVSSPAPEEEPSAPVPSIAVPLIGGTLAVNERWAAASDPDAGRVAFASWVDGGATAVVVDVGIDAAPAQVAWVGEAQDQLAVLLRGSGSVALIAADGEPALTATVPVCPAPAGLAWDAQRGRTWVTCASGELVALTADGTVESSRFVDLDLRDIVLLPSGRAFVSQLRSATVFTVDLDTGAIVDRQAARGDSVVESTGVATHFTARVLRRLVSDGMGGAVALYQMHEDGPIELPDPDAPPPKSEDSTAYGGSFDGCDGVVRTAIAALGEGGVFPTPTGVPGTSGVVVDLAVGTGGEVEFIAASGAVLTWAGSTSCRSEFIQSGPGLPTSVVYVDGGLYLTAREPFFLGTLTEYLDPDLAPSKGAEPEEQKMDSGLALFHAAPHGVACASCHPEGGEDGHVWRFVTGARRTQSLAGLVVSETAPYHWNGDLATFDDLFHDVGVLRMGMPSNDVDTVLLLDFLDRLPRPPSAALVADPDLVARGAELFVDATVGCADCHNSWRYSDDSSADVGTGGALQVPSLIGVGSRSPWMHDGCAVTLHDRFTDPWCGGGDLHGVTSHLPAEDLDALVAYLQTL